MTRYVHISIIIGLLLAGIILIISAMGNVQAENARLHMNFKEDLGFVPETNPREGGPYPALQVYAQYTELGITRTNKQWVLIETWASDDRDANMTITFETLNFFYTIAQEGYDAEPELRVTAMVDGGTIYQDTHSFTDHDDGEMREEIMNFPEIMYRVAQWETLEFQLEYAGYEDLIFGYDHRIRDSGVTSVTDFLYTWNMSAKDTEVVLEVADIHHSNWEAVGNFINLSVDGEPLSNQTFSISEGVPHQVGDFMVNSSYITWKLDDPLEGGEEVEIWIKYIDADLEADLGMRKTVRAESGSLVKPVAEITSIEPDQPYEDDEVTFDASGSSDEDGSVVWYHWESDMDGVLFDGDDPDFARSDLSVGEHGITLKVRDDDDLWSEVVSVMIEVLEQEVNKVPTVVLKSPANESVIDVTEVVLSWEGEDDDGDELTFDVYLDETAETLTRIADDREQDSLELFDLVDGTTYYWKVVASDGTDETDSKVWSFTVELPDEPGNTAPSIVLLSPADESELADPEVQLMWRGEDADGDDLWYTVWIGTLSIAPLDLDPIAENLSVSSHLFSGDGETTYFWMVTVHDGQDSVNSEVRSFTIASDDGDDDDDDFEIAGENGYMVIGGMVAGIVVLAVVVFMFTRRGGEWEDEYDDGYDHDR
jgi:hypothetical protein